MSITSPFPVAPQKGALDRCIDAYDAPNQVAHRNCANVLGIPVEALDMESAVCRVRETLRSGQKGYVCAIGVHGIMEAQRDPRLAQAFAQAAITVPDGMPTAWVGRFQGFQGMQRVAGPDLMLEIFGRPEFADYRHFLYGGKDGVANELAAALRTRFPWTRIVGTYTPPFRDLTPAESNALVDQVALAGPDIVWVGISTPKQDLFMHDVLERLDTQLMFGVGAAFDFHTGRIRDCAPWIKRAGLQWLHRLMQEPMRLGRRYLKNNPAFLWRVALQLLGIRAYPLPSSVNPNMSQAESLH